MLKVIIRGGGDLASGIAARLHRSGIKVVITELEQPLSVRRFVSFSEAIYNASTVIEDIEAKSVKTIEEFENCFARDIIPVLIDGDLSLCSKSNIRILVDARMIKKEIKQDNLNFLLRIGIGPGFSPGVNCDCVIETKRGPFLGRVYWNGTAETDTGIPEKVKGYVSERVLRSPANGVFTSKVRIGDTVEKDEILAMVNGEKLLAPFAGLVRGLLHDGVSTTTGMKVGDLDPRFDALLCSLISDKALAIGGGVLEAILSNQEFRKELSS